MTVENKNLVEKNNDLIEQHWDYIWGLLDVTLTKQIYTKQDIMDMCEFHYRTAWKHGAKHYAELIDGRG